MKKRGMLTMVLASAMAVSTLAAVPAAADETEDPAKAIPEDKQS